VDLRQAENVRLINSVRGWIEVEGMAPTGFQPAK